MRMQDDDYLPALFEALIADALGKPLPEQAHATGVLGSMLRDLKSTGWVLPTRADERYRALLKNVMAVFDRTSVGIPLQSRLEAAEALGAAGDHRLRTPDQEDYWVRVKGNGNKIADFAIGRFPVTVQEYLLYLEAKPQAEKPREWDEQETFRNWPVAGVSRHEAMDYCAWATEQSGFAVTLPTDAQWEWAAAGPEDRLYPWGDEDPTPEHANYRGTGIRPKPTPVGLFPAGNTPGKEPIYDLAGNVWEWTRTVYGAKKEEQGVRGGSFYYVARALRAAYRVDFVASFRYNFIGFRCIRE
jgi:formylglycine-generating enzyme required for sulfatase activity